MTAASREKGWPLRLSGLFRRPPFAITTTLSVIGISVFALLICIGVLSLAWLLVDLVSGDQRRAAEATKAALPILAGVVGLPLIIWRLIILDRQTQISEAKTQIDRETHYTSIFARAIEQLGQTREVKRTIQSVAGKEETTTTVPNIEVRLGGIHALARLAEESVRDRDKIGNTLRAYIRENSWSSRAGDLITKLTWDPASAWDWSRYPHSPAPLEATLAAKNAWIKTIDGQLKELNEWSASVPETRVDVNEAADALALQEPLRDTFNKYTLYECLFVGRLFTAQLLSLIDFKRCIFVRCSFDATSCRFAINESLIVGTRFFGSNADVQLEFCQLSGASFRLTERSKLGTYFCQAFDARVSGDLASLTLHDSTLYNVQLIGRYSRDDISTKLIVDDCMVVKSRLRGLRFGSDSEIGFGPLPDVAFEGADLATVVHFDPATLNAATATANTTHPAHSLRPSSWPPYSPN